MGYWLTAIAAAAIAIAAGYLFLLNDAPVAVHLSPSSVTTVPLAGALLAAFAAGALLIGLVTTTRAGVQGWHAWRQRRQARREARRHAATARAKELVWTGEYAQARAELLHAPEAPPADVTRTALLAETHLAEGDPTAARTLLEQALAQTGPEPHLLDLLASAAEATGDVPGAIEALERAAAGKPGSPRLVTRLRDLLAASGRFGDAAGLQGELLLGLRSPEALAIEERRLRGLRYQATLSEPDDRTAARRLGTLAREAPGFVAAWVSAGDRWLRAGRPTSARRAWERGAKRAPAVVLLERLEQHPAMAAHPARMTRLYRALRRRHPENCTLALCFVRHLLATDALDEAARELAVVPEGVGATPAAQNLRAELHRRRGDLPRAAEAFARALGPGLGLATPLRCTRCGAPAPTWEGRCAACGSWDTLAAPAEEAAPGTGAVRT